MILHFRPWQINMTEYINTMMSVKYAMSHMKIIFKMQFFQLRLFILNT